MLDRLRSALARAIAPKLGRTVRAYANARPSRLTAGWQTPNTSADTELHASLTALRSRSRALVRDASYAKRARVVVQNNVIGSGIGLQAQVMTTRNELNDRINDAIEEAFCEWSRADSCHTGGSLHFADMERAAMGQVFEAGEIFFRKHYQKFGDSQVPFALEMIEAERLADDFVNPGPTVFGNTLRMGIEVDAFYRPIAYWFRQRHPGELRFINGQQDKFERVPAEHIIHLRIIDRWPQTRGEPWLHTAVRRLNDMDGYAEAEIVAARGAANYMGIITTPENSNPLGQPAADGTYQTELQPGIVDKLNPGEEFEFVSPNRPNPNMDPFMRMMLREVAAGIGVSYESLSRDYSKSNYSSSRLALLEDRDLWRVVQGWFIRTFRDEVHRVWLQQAVLANAIPEIAVQEYAANPSKFRAVRYKPRGWTWIDPTKEVDAYKNAVRCGFTTVADVIAQTNGGTDLEDVLNGRRRELDMMKGKDLKFDTDPDFNLKGDMQGDLAPEPAAADPADPPADENSANSDDPPARVVSIQR